MRIAIIIAAATALLTISVQAQTMIPGQGPIGGLPKMNNSAPVEEQRPVSKADEQAYKSALDGIAPKQSHDPWGNVREKPQSNNSR